MLECAAPRARSEDMARRPLPQVAALDSVSAVSSPSDPATEGNDDAPTAHAPSPEGEPRSRYRDARLDSTDKVLKAEATAKGSAPTALGTPWQREPRAEVMDPGL